MFEKTEAERFLRKHHFSKTTKGLNIALFEYAVSEKDAKKALEIQKQETAKQIFDLLDHEIYSAVVKGRLPMTINFTDYEKIKTKFLLRGKNEGGIKYGTNRKRKRRNISR